MRKANKTRSIIDWEKSIKKKIQVTKLKNKLKQEYFNNLLSEDAKPPEQLWKTLKTLVPGGKTSTTSVKRLVTEDGEKVTRPKVIVEHFNKCFVNVGVTLSHQTLPK